MDSPRPFPGARVYGEHSIISRHGTEFPISISSFTACQFLTTRFLMKMSDLGIDCLHKLWLLEGADQDDEQKLNGTLKTSCFIANLHRIGPVVSHTLNKNTKFEGSTSYTPLKKLDPDGEHNLRRYHCSDGSYRKWFQSDYTLSRDFGCISKKGKPSNPPHLGQSPCPAKINIKHVPQVPILVSAHSAW